MNTIVKKRLLVIGKILLFLIFAIVYQQSGLFSSNQNTYFLHGLADAGVDHLKYDWLVHTADPFPLFSGLVYIVTKFLWVKVFYIFYFIILAIYCFSIIGIVAECFNFEKIGIRYLTFFIVFTIWHAGYIADYLWGSAVIWRIADIFEPGGILLSGVAQQFILGPIFQPSTFGVFLVLSIYLFIKNRVIWASVSLSVAAVFHSTYLLGSAVLMLSFILIIVIKEKDYRKAFLAGAISFIIVLPYLLYAYLNFAPTNNELFNEAQNILVNFRIPHHAIVKNWFDVSSVFQILIVVYAIFIVRKTKLWLVLFMSFIVSAILTLIQLFTNSDSLALLFPWRISVFLVPISSSIILAKIINILVQSFGKPFLKIRRPVLSILLVIILILGYSGINRAITLFNSPKIGQTALTKFAASSYQKGDVYLIPPELGGFRLASGVPVFVDIKSHPYKDLEFVEWYNMIKIAKDFYNINLNVICEKLRNICAKYKISHVVVGIRSEISGCEIVNEVYRDDEYIVYEIK